MEYKTRDPELVFEEMEAMARKYEHEETEYVTTATVMFYQCKKQIFRKEDLMMLEMGNFQGFQFPIPKNYDKVLKTIYGDYMKYPPVETRGNWHDSILLNPNIPYKQFREQLLSKEEKK